MLKSKIETFLKKSLRDSDRLDQFNIIITLGVIPANPSDCQKIYLYELQQLDNFLSVIISEIENS